MSERIESNNLSASLVRAIRMDVAAKVDSGQISVADAKLQFAREVYEINQRDEQTCAANQAGLCSRASLRHARTLRLADATTGSGARPWPHLFGHSSNVGERVRGADRC
jgi:hypothetical protein